MPPEPGTPPAGEPPAGTPPAGEPPAGTPPAGTPPAGEPPAGDTPTSWINPDVTDWREQIAGKDESKLNMLKRITDPNALVENYFEAQKTIRERSEQMSALNALPEDATDEQIQAFREKNGIPDKPEDYELKLSDGLVLSDEDRQEFAPIFEFMHAQNVNGKVASGVVDHYLKVQNQLVAAEQAQDSTEAALCKKALQDAWGGDYATNENLVKGMLAAHLPEDAIDGFMGARMADGTAVFNNPGVVAALASMARTINPAATLVPSGEDAITSMSDRLRELKGMMGSDEWYKRPDLQKEYQNILTAQETIKGRQSA